MRAFVLLSLLCLLVACQDATTPAASADGGQADAMGAEPDVLEDAAAADVPGEDAAPRDAAQADAAVADAAVADAAVADALAADAGDPDAALAGGHRLRHQALLLLGGAAMSEGHDLRGAGSGGWSRGRSERYRMAGRLSP